MEELLKEDITIHSLKIIINGLSLMMKLFHKLIYRKCNLMVLGEKIEIMITNLDFKNTKMLIYFFTKKKIGATISKSNRIIYFQIY